MSRVAGKRFPYEPRAIMISGTFVPATPTGAALAAVNPSESARGLPTQGRLGRITAARSTDGPIDLVRRPVR